MKPQNQKLEVALYLRGDDIELLSRPVNFAVVQLPERKHPGVVIQGDTLNGLVRRLEGMRSLLKEGVLDDLALEIEDVGAQLSGALDHFEAVCTERGIELPYPKLFPRS